jgi:hypothetical protein
MPTSRRAIPKDAAVYQECMEKARQRINIARTIAAGRIATGHPVLDTELSAVQFRKVLELIAFASIAANREAYAAVQPKFGMFNRARDILKELQRLNPDFYPVPLEPAVEQPDGTKRFEAVADAFLTKSEFAVLYDGTSEIVHMQNPYSTNPAKLPTQYTIEGWAVRIQTLLKCHRVHLIGGGVWVVDIPVSGEIRLHPGSPSRSC